MKEKNACMDACCANKNKTVSVPGIYCGTVCAPAKEPRTNKKGSVSKSKMEDGTLKAKTVGAKKKTEESALPTFNTSDSLASASSNISNSKSLNSDNDLESKPDNSPYSLSKCTDQGCTDVNCKPQNTLNSGSDKSSCSDPKCNDTSCKHGDNSHARNTFFGIAGVLIIVIIGYMTFLKLKEGKRQRLSKSLLPNHN